MALTFESYGYIIEHVFDDKAEDFLIDEVGEPIDVSAVFAGGVKPVAFRWRNRRYIISQITGRYSALKGGYRRYAFAVRADTDEIYELTLDTRSMAWRLERVHTVG
ncbi:MAG: hypothetical protein M1548_10025 [Actinobacteria bacterium]|nr:hypothetical protein [Actinomycetota bacterium]